MCENCGCSGHHHEHVHEHNHGHAHHTDDICEHTHTRPDGSTYTHVHDHTEAREVTIGSAILSANNQIAECNRQWFAEHRVLALNLISSPGSGKTALLVETLRRLQEKNISCAVIVGDQYGDIDARRMQNSGFPVTHIETHSSCHLDARRIRDVLVTAVPENTQIVFIENVGNLVCPVAFDLGENAKIALLSAPEGEEKPLKYPALFAAAELILLTKCDLDEVLEYDSHTAIENINHINPRAKILRCSAKSKEGMDGWIKFLLDKIQSF